VPGTGFSPLSWCCSSYLVAGFAGGGKEKSSVEIIDDYTLEVVNWRPITTANSPGYWSWNPVIPQHILEEYADSIPEYPNEETIGSGPFKLKEYEEEEYMWLVANEDYWGGRPYLDEVVFRYYGNPETMLMALKKGDIDTFGNEDIPVYAIEELKADPNIKVEIAKGLGLEWLSFNLHKETALQDKTVRQAIMTAIDCDRIIDMAQQDAGGDRLPGYRRGRNQKRSKNRSESKL